MNPHKLPSDYIKDRPFVLCLVFPDVEGKEVMYHSYYKSDDTRTIAVRVFLNEYEESVVRFGNPHQPFYRVGGFGRNPVLCSDTLRKAVLYEFEFDLSSVVLPNQTE